MIEAIEVAGLDPTKLMPANNPVQQAQASPIDVRGFSEALRNAGVDGTNATPSVSVANPSEGTKALVAALDNLSSGASSVSDIAQRISQNPDSVKPSDMIETPALKGRKLDWSCEPPSGKMATHLFCAR